MTNTVQDLHRLSFRTWREEESEHTDISMSRYTHTHTHTHSFFNYPGLQTFKNRLITFIQPLVCKDPPAGEHITISYFIAVNLHFFKMKTAMLCCELFDFLAEDAAHPKIILAFVGLKFSVCLSNDIRFIG